MSETAAHLVDPVIPHVPARQWVLSLPIALRLLQAAQPGLVTPVVQGVQVVQRVFARHLLDRAGFKADEGHSRAVMLIDATDVLLRRLVTSGAFAPALWPLEVLNGLAMGERRGRLGAETRQRLGGFLRDLPVDIDAETAAQAWLATATLAGRHQLSVYDAAYLELAQRLALPLATRDRALRGAARSLGVALLGEAGDLPAQ